MNPKLSSRNNNLQLNAYIGNQIFSKIEHHIELSREVVDYIHTHFVCKNSAFRVGNKENSDSENQRACVVIAYGLYMGYTFKKVKALFGEHDHLCLITSSEEREEYISNQHDVGGFAFEVT